MKRFQLLARDGTGRDLQRTFIKIAAVGCLPKSIETIVAKGVAVTKPIARLQRVMTATDLHQC